MYNFPAWYQSTTGPQISKTLMNIAGNILPMLNFVLQSRGINILPESVNTWITLIVFFYFSIQSAIGYIRAKTAMGVKVANLAQKVEALGGTVEEKDL